MEQNVTKRSNNETKGFENTQKSIKVCKIKLKQRIFLSSGYCRTDNNLYLCNVFFMVLDLRLTKIGCRETINFFCAYPNYSVANN